MAAILSFRELEVYQLALHESARIVKLTRRFPKEEQYALTSQIRAASRAVSAMIAEAWARRRYAAVFVNKLDEALGEATETQAWLDHSLYWDYIDAALHREFDNAWQHVGAMLNRMIARVDDFCGNAKR